MSQNSPSIALDGGMEGFVDLGDTEGKYLTFFTDGQLFGVPISEVVQIVGMQEITAIPEYPAYAKGIINLRGSIIPVIDIRLRLGKNEAEYNDRTCVIVINVCSAYFGFIVDEVDEVTDIESSLIAPPPRVSGESMNQYLTGVAQLGEKIVLLIDATRILGRDEFDALASAAR